MTIWFSSDHHFGHANLIYKFKIKCPECKGTGVFDKIDLDEIPCMVCGAYGEVPMRDFKNLNQMHETIVMQHNARVKPNDHWYCLGDLTMARHLRDIDGVLQQMNGHKRIILGNHDVAPIKDYVERFEKVMSYRVLDNIMFSHIPIHEMSLGKFSANVHGHTHANPSPKGRYINISLEMTEYAPVSLEELKARIAKLEV